MTDLEVIVRALAQADEPVESSQGTYCALCGVELQVSNPDAQRAWEQAGRPRGFDSGLPTWLYRPHNPACPWRMAREWVGLPTLRGPDGLLTTETP